MDIAKDYGNVCKSHSARSEKEFCRVCPSNLNKKELENVYFTLLENNLDLKTTINSQREKIKILSTKVQRLTTLQKNYLGKEPKECCGSKAVINEQKECILELRRSNQCLMERIRQLNMRLCSAKQFLKRSPFQSTSRCNRCSNKNRCLSVLTTKGSETNLRATAASSQYLVKDLVSSRTAADDIVSHDKGVQYDFCDENKCRNRIEELKKKNDDLQEETYKMKESHATVTSQLEREVSELRAENVRVRGESALAATRAGQLSAQLADVTVRLGSSDLRCDELSVELAVEKRRVSELETRMRAADMSSRIASAIGAHFTISESVEVQNIPNKPMAAVRTKIPHVNTSSVQGEEVFKGSDDSGYTETNKSQEFGNIKFQPSTYLNQVLLEKIADLQNQINKLKSFKNQYNSPNETLNVSQEFNIENAQMSQLNSTLNTKQPSEENLISESSDSVITEKKANIPIATISTRDKYVNESKIQSSSPVNKSKEVCGEYENIAIEEYGDIKGETIFKNGYKHFRRKSKDVDDKAHSLIIGSRKFSLHGLSVTPREKNVYKTGSLDETRTINVEGIKTEDIKKIDVSDVVKESSKKSQSNRVNEHKDASNVTDKVIPYTINKNHQDGNETIIQNNTVVENANNSRKLEMKRDSDPSEGTYSIHRNDGAPKLTTNNKCLDINKEDKELSRKTTTHKDSYTLAVASEKVLNNSTYKDKLVQRRRSIPSDHGTYVKGPRDESPESTECEISSISDLPDERNNFVRSPGEEKPTTASDSRTDVDTTTTDYGSLSEGELPYLRDATVLSEGEKRQSYRATKSHSSPVQSGRQMELALAAVGRELGRCTSLLRDRARRPPAAPPE